MTRPNVITSNILGAARAEIDSTMLARAFVETADFGALTRTTDFNFVVGRRGAGKSALFRKTLEFFQKDRAVITCFDTPKEHHSLEIRDSLRETLPNYNLTRAISRLAWKIGILISVTRELLNNYKIAKTDDYTYLLKYKESHRHLFSKSISEICVTVLTSYASSTTTKPTFSLASPSQIAKTFDEEKLKTAVIATLDKLALRATVLFDGLDEGWEPTAGSTAILGGLAAAISSLAEASDRLYCVIFTRDNMFRALANFDTDFSRNIENNTLRLHWDTQSLLKLVASRLRVALEIPQIESEIRVWNRFAHRELRERGGFNYCLKQTLYRPRDILALLNRAFAFATKQGREALIEDDIEMTSTSISQDRLEDLLKEYNDVLPGLRHFVKIFEGRARVAKFASVLTWLDEAVKNATFSSFEESDFAVLGSGRQIFLALYSVGFVGLKNPSDGTYSFCYDGSATNADDIFDGRDVAIHPCYWKALGFKDSELPEELAITIGDEYGEQPQPAEVKELRTARLGQVIDELPNLPLGRDGSAQFEKWVNRAVSILFAGSLKNIQIKPNTDSLQRRDVVATNMATQGFWKRVLDDYKARQVIFEVKNYEALTIEDFRQACSYASRDYGNFVVLVTRSTSEGLSQHERAWVKEMYDTQQKLLFPIPALILKRCLAKLRNPKRHDYTEDALGKRLDTFIRSYLSNRHERHVRGRK